MLPADPTKRRAAEAVLNHLETTAAAQSALEDAFVPDSRTEPTELPPRSAREAGMTLSAAWLCELLDTYASLDERHRRLAESPGAFEASWGSLWHETVERLTGAMRSMSEADWASLDRFPERAGQVRVMTDRLREDFRRRRVGTAATERPEVTATLPKAAVDARSVPHRPPDSPAEALGRILAERGFTVDSLPMLDPCDSTDFIARRDDGTLIVRLHRLGGRAWQASEGSLGPWRAGSDMPIPSPCRAVWQRITLLRALVKEARLSGVVVVEGGSFIDESELAAAMTRDRQRSAVALAWLDQDGRPLPSVGNYLSRC
jgi:hypothetical protein